MREASRGGKGKNCKTGGGRERESSLGLRLRRSRLGDLSPAREWPAARLLRPLWATRALRRLASARPTPRVGREATSLECIRRSLELLARSPTNSLAQSRRPNLAAPLLFSSSSSLIASGAHGRHLLWRLNGARRAPLHHGKLEAAGEEFRKGRTKSGQTMRPSEIGSA